MTEQKEINISLTLSEVEVIIEAIGELPFKTVAPIVYKVQEQIKKQGNTNYNLLRDSVRDSKNKKNK